MKHPEWALKHKKKGTELRYINGRYYLYEVTSRWNPEKKRAQKITGRLLGKITPEGFIESPKYALSKKAEVRRVSVREYGATRFLFDLMPEMNERLKKAFPSEYMHILAIAAMRLLYESPIKNMGFYYRESYLSEELKGVSLGQKKVSSVLREIGRGREGISEFFRGGLSDASRGDHVLIDATYLLSQSGGLGDVARHGYNSKGEHLPQVNLMFLYSMKKEIPVYYRILPGDIREVKAFALTMKEAGLEDAVVIADKGFYSRKNIEALEGEGLRFIVPLRRDIGFIDYTRISEGKKGFDGYFKYRERYIWYCRYEVEGKMLHLYLDERLRQSEESDYLDRIESHPEDYSIEGFHEKAERFGTLAVLTNVAGMDSEEIYGVYKSRNQIELMIDAMKNVLGADRSYMRNREALEGWLFTTFIGLQWYYRIYRLLSENGLLKKYSPRDLLMHLCSIKKVLVNDQWHTSEITRKTEKLLHTLGIHIT